MSQTSNPKWISKEQLLYIHRESLRLHGGGGGMRDEGLLESALARAENLYAYERADIFQLAATYAIGVARNHAFVDGNKRTAYSVAGLFLHINGFTLQILSVDTQITLFEDVATGKITQDDLAAFYRENTLPR